MTALESTGGSAAILVVDDRAEQRLAVRVVLDELGEVVEASSGREALRWLLRRQFAAILLDVNMPEMDGFETAALIRQRTSSEHTPILFVTAHADDLLEARGYSMGACDYILTPVDPQVIRAKVGIFLELFRQAESLRRYAMQLERLSDAAIAIHGTRSLDDLLRVLADAALSVLGAAQVSIEVHSPGENGAAAASRRLQRPEGTALEAFTDLLELAREPVRMTRAQLEGHPQWATLGSAGQVLPMRGWLAAPLSNREGCVLGWIQLSEKRGSDFEAEDEALLVQLAQLGSIAAENLMLHQFEEASRLKDQFLATVSHELRTPLQSILTWSMTLLEQSVDEVTLRRGHEVIRRNARAQARLIEELLDVSRIITGKIAIERIRVRLARAVERSLEDAQPEAARRNIAIEFEREGDPWILGDPGRLQQILANLFSNAVKFSPPDGRVQVWLGSDGDEACIRMCDGGEGIAPEFLPHVFEPFRQGDSSMTRSQRGLGIGLSIVRHLVELHRGTVRAESEGQGRGATFILRFPLVPEAAAQSCCSAAASAVESDVRLDGIRVLLVEDEPDTLDSLAFALEQLGAEVLAVASAEEALQILDRGDIHVLLSDLAMPDEDGFSLIRRVRARPTEASGRIPAAALSAYSRSEDRARALLSGFDLHIAKPVEPLELGLAVLRLIARARS